MYLIFGRRAKVLKRAAAYPHACNHCGQEKVSVVGMVKYLHIFWVPVLNYSKKLITVCGHCKKQVELGSGQADALEDIKKDLVGFKRTWGYNFILLSILVLFAYSFVANMFV